MLAPTDLDNALAQAQEAVDALAQGVTAFGPSTVAAPTVQNVEPRSTAPPQRTAVTDVPVKLSPHLRRILNLRVPVIVRVAQRPILLNDVLKLIPGNILEFDRPVHEELDLLVNNRQIGSGVAVKINEHFGIKINSIGEPRDRFRQITE